MAEYRHRIIDSLLTEELEAMGAVLLEGAKACGKTTTAEQASRSVIYMDDPDRSRQYLQTVDTEARKLLEGPTPRLLDEWQIAPKLWDAVRFEVDHRKEDGQFILTGSAVTSKSARDKIHHSGTGRFAWLRMRPMTLQESGDSIGAVSLASLFDNPSVALEGENRHRLDDMAFLACRGGWPKALEKKTPKIALRQAVNYFEAIVRTDISRVDDVEKDEFRTRRIMRAFARHQGSSASVSTILSDIRHNDNAELSDKTVYSYINALKGLFVIEDMPAWNPNLRSKSAIRTADTRYYVDPSIACAALGLGPEDLVNDLNTFGLIFETLCVRDLRVYSQPLEGTVFHYRDSTGLECDTVVHLCNGKYGLIEIKLGGDRLIDEGAANLLKLRSKLDTTRMKAPSFLMVLTAVGPYAYRRPDGVLVVPVSTLGV